MRPRKLSAAAVIVAGAWAASAPTLHSQDVSGVVLDADTGEPVAEAAVQQLRGGEVVRSARSDETGRFRLRTRGGPPFELHVERIGYTGRTLVVERPPASGEILEVELEPHAVMLEGVDVGVRRERLNFRFRGWRVTEGGMLLTGRPEGILTTEPFCIYLMLDSVVIRDPQLYMPEDVERYEPANTVQRRVSFFHSYPPSQLADRRLREDAWPCGTANITYVRHEPALFRNRRPPAPDAPAYTLWAAERINLPSGEDPRAVLVAVSGRDRLAAGVAGGTDLFLRDSGEGEWRGARLGLDRVSEIGWRGDTLWAADHEAGRLAFASPDAEAPEIREGEGVLAPGYRSGIPDPPEETDPESRAPIPLPGARWLWERPAPDAPYPPRPEHMPPGRLLVVLDDDWRVGHVVTALRPGAQALAREIEGSPPQPFRDHPLAMLSPNGDHLTVVDRRLEKAVWWTVYSVTRLSLEGDTLFHVDRGSPLIRPDEDHFDAVADHYADHPSLRRAFASETARRLLARGRLYRPTFFPPISDIAVGRDGTTWLRWPDDWSGQVRWDVIDSVGRPIHTLMLDRGVRILDADGARVWATVALADGGAEVVRFDLERAP